ncbi:hypothetical protein SAY87_012567 [Trapa incisa]|uniref:Pathogenesis-related protein 5 n=2 Tax=Trapa TaxID=22665 RepID=A0AAN7LKZ0_TRANT|nr:hypothetical protein SAY87_012567 [Trapa incisa]KAK4787530.1 hypothetical protein SAY86_011363 [Trapa natans]
MAIPSGIHIFLLLLTFTGIDTVASTTVFTIQNQCSYTVWPGTLSGNGGTVLGDGGFELAPGDSVQLTAQPGWSGRFWGRTECSFDPATGAGKCATGGCGGLKCPGGGTPPVTLVEFTLASSSSEKDFYDVSLVDGYNIGMAVKPTGDARKGDCQAAGCQEDLNKNCPPELQVVMVEGPSPSPSPMEMEIGMGRVVACKSACEAFNAPELCCTGDHSTPENCPPTHYSAIFKQACPTAYSYAYDDATSTCTCSATDYTITFCPSVSN